jgi:predicted O-methyltransferase YrrM
MSMLAKCYYRIGATRLGHLAARSTLQAVRRLGAMREFHTALDALALPHPATRQLMRLWQRMHWSSGDGMMPAEELLTIYALTYQAAAGGDMVELGCWKGLTTCYLAAACRARRSGRVYAVDTFEGTREYGQKYASIARFDGSTRGAFERQIRKAGMQDWVFPCTGLTAEYAAKYDGGPIAFLLIDADHSYEGVKADFEAWSPHVARGGTIVFHDYNMPEAGVRAYVQAEIAGRADFPAIPDALPPNIYAVTKA